MPLTLYSRICGLLGTDTFHTLFAFQRWIASWHYIPQKREYLALGDTLRKTLQLDKALTNHFCIPKSIMFLTSFFHVRELFTINIWINSFNMK